MKVVGGADQWLSLAYTSELNIVFGQLILGGFWCLYVRGLTGPSFYPKLRPFPFRVPPLFFHQAWLTWFSCRIQTSGFGMTFWERRCTVAPRKSRRSSIDARFRSCGPYE